MTVPWLRDIPALIAIHRERYRQIQVEGHSPADDDGLRMAELSRAAAAFALLAAAGVSVQPHEIRKWAAAVWPFAPEKLREKRSPQRMLVIAGALIFAEIERLERARLALQARLAACRDCPAERGGPCHCLLAAPPGIGL